MRLARITSPGRWDRRSLRPGYGTTHGQSKQRRLLGDRPARCGCVHSHHDVLFRDVGHVCHGFHRDWDRRRVHNHGPSRSFPVCREAPKRWFRRFRASDHGEPEHRPSAIAHRKADGKADRTSHQDRGTSGPCAGERHALAEHWNMIAIPNERTGHE